MNHSIPSILRLLVIIGLTLIVACSGNPARQNEEAGMVIGAIVGGVLGAQVGDGHGRDIAIVAGTLAGAAVGGAIGRSMDETDRLRTAQTLETVRTGVSSHWRNPDSGAVYTVTPTRTFDRGTGPCREYVIDAEIGGEPQKIYGTACRQPDGSWKVMS